MFFSTYRKSPIKYHQIITSSLKGREADFLLQYLSSILQYLLRKVLDEWYDIALVAIRAWADLIPTRISSVLKSKVNLLLL